MNRKPALLRKDIILLEGLVRRRMLYEERRLNREMPEHQRKFKAEYINQLAELLEKLEAKRGNLEKPTE